MMSKSSNEIDSNLDITELICVICLEPYNEIKIALILCCGHTYCSQCLLQIHRNEQIVCPEDRSETYVQLVDHLVRNISLIRMTYDDEKRQLLHQQKELLENIQILRKNIKSSVESKRKPIETYLQRICLHKTSLESFYNSGYSLSNKLSTVNQLKEIEPCDKENLNMLIEQIADDYNKYENLKESILNSLIKLDDLENKSTFSIILHELVNIEQEVSVIDNKYLTAEHKAKINQQLDESIEIFNYLKEFENKYFHGIFDLQNNECVKLNDIVDGLEYDMKFAKFRIGIVGNSGKGKSSFINRARGMSDPKNFDNTKLQSETDEYEIGAPTGVGETTKFPISYSWKEKPTILLKDFPGFGLCKEPIVENYLNKYLLKDNCHVYIILYTERLTSCEIELAKLIKTKLKKHVILARSKIDRDFAELSENEENKSDITLFKILKMRLNYEVNQQEFDSYFDKTFERKDLKVFLISCKRGYETKFEMNRFFKEIFNCLPNELSDQTEETLSNVFLNLSKIEIHKIKERLEQRILALAFLSATTDILPIAGQIADVTILIAECTRYRNYFCLRKDYINELGTKYNISEERVASILKIVAFDAKYLNLKDFVLGLVSAISIGISVFQAVTSAVSLGINIATFGAGCLVSAMITGPLSFYLCKNVLKKALEQMEQDALKIIEEIHKEIKLKN